MKKLFLIVALFLSCTTENPVTPMPSVTGSWVLAESNGDFITAIQYNFADNHTFEMFMGMKSMTTEITIAEQYGTWTQSGDVVTVSPVSCKSLDTLSETLSVVPCGNPAVYTISDDALTALDKSYSFARLK